MMIEFKENDETKYSQEHAACDEYYETVVKTDKEKFEQHYETWK